MLICCRPQVLLRPHPESIPYGAPSEDLDLSGPDVYVGAGVVLVCTAAAAVGAGAVDASGFAADEGDAALEEGVGHFSEVAVVAGSDPTPPGFRRQLLFGASEPGDELLGGGGEAGTAALCTAYTVARRPIIALAIVSGDARDVAPPAGFEVVSGACVRVCSSPQLRLRVLRMCARLCEFVFVRVLCNVEIAATMMCAVAHYCVRIDD